MARAPELVFSSTTLPPEASTPWKPTGPLLVLDTVVLAVVEELNAVTNIEGSGLDKLA